MAYPLISVIVPVYNGRKYLRECIESIKAQTYKNLEIIIVNDGSTDGTEELIEELVSTDGRIKSAHKENGGVSSARNLGLSLAKGELIGFVDSDDLILPDAYEYLYDGLTHTGADVAQCATIYENGALSFVISSPKKDVVLPSDKALANKDFADAFAYGSCSKLFKRSVIGNIRFSEKYIIGEDLRFNLDALAASEKTVLLTDAKYRYVRRDGGATSAEPSLRSLTSFRNMALEAESDFRDRPVFLKYITTERLRTGLDICSKLVRFSPEGCDELFAEIRQSFRSNRGFINKNERYSAKEKLKFRLISYFPTIYRGIIKNKQ